MLQDVLRASPVADTGSQRSWSKMLRDIEFVSRFLSARRANLLVRFFRVFRSVAQAKASKSKEAGNGVPQA